MPNCAVVDLTFAAGAWGKIGEDKPTNEQYWRGPTSQSAWFFRNVTSLDGHDGLPP